MVDKLQLSENAAAGVEFVRCHRINEFKRASTCKPIIVRFENYNERELIWSKKSLLTDRNCNVSEDFPRKLLIEGANYFLCSVKPEELPVLTRNLLL